MRATLRNFTQAPRKVRLVARLIQGRRADEALVVLSHTPRKASEALAKLIRSALANAAHQGGSADPAAWRVASVRVDKGMRLRRWRPQWRGMAFPIRRDRSHIRLELATVTPQREQHATGRAVAERSATR